MDNNLDLQACKERILTWMICGKLQLKTYSLNCLLQKPISFNFVLPVTTNQDFRRIQVLAKRVLKDAQWIKSKGHHERREGRGRVKLDFTWL